MTRDDPGRSEALARIERVYRMRMLRRDNADARVPDRMDRTDALKQAAYARRLSKHQLMPLGRCDVLDVGCQWGAWLAWCRQAWGHDGGRLCGIDLMREWIDKGKARYDFLDLRHGSGDRLPWDDETFDLVHQGMVFSSVLDADLREGIAAEMRRMVRPGGHVLWYDFFFNPINRDTVGMTYRRVKRYFPGWTTMARDRVTLAPPLSRVLGRIGPNAIDLLTSLRFLNFHYLILLRKPPA